MRIAILAGVLVLVGVNGYALHAALSSRDPVAAVPDAADPSQADEGGRILVVTDPLDFGSRFDDEQFDLELRLRNVGHGPLRISGIQTGCGCAKVVPPKEPIPPGSESLPIPIRIRLAGISGDYEKVGFVTSNDGTARRVTFTIRGKVLERLAIEPRTLDLQCPDHVSPAAGTFRVTARGGLTLESLAVRTPGEAVTAEVGPGDDPATEAVVRLTVDPRGRELRTGVMIRVGSVERAIGIRALPARDVVAVPERLSLGLTARDVPHRIALRATRDVEWKIVGVETDRADLLAVEKEGGVEVRWASSVPDGFERGLVRVRLSGATPPVVEIPVLALVGEGRSVRHDAVAETRAPGGAGFHPAGLGRGGRPASGR